MPQPDPLLLPIRIGYQCFCFLLVSGTLGLKAFSQLIHRLTWKGWGVNTPGSSPVINGRWNSNIPISLWEMFYFLCQSSPRRLTIVFTSIILFNIVPFFWRGEVISLSLFSNFLFCVSWNHRLNKQYLLIISISSHNYYSMASFISNIQIITLSPGLAT